MFGWLPVWNSNACEFSLLGYYCLYQSTIKQVGQFAVLPWRIPANFLWKNMSVLNFPKTWTALISVWGQIRVESAGYTLVNSFRSKSWACGWALAGKFDRGNWSAAVVVKAPCASKFSPHMMRWHRYVIGGPGKPSQVCDLELFCSDIIPDVTSAMCLQQSHWLLDRVPEEQSDLSRPWNSWCCVIYSGADFFPHPMNFNIFLPLFSGTKEAITCVSALQDVIPPITLQHSNHHMSCGGEKKIPRHHQRWKQQTECWFPSGWLFPPPEGWD